VPVFVPVPCDEACLSLLESRLACGAQQVPLDTGERVIADARSDTSTRDGGRPRWVSEARGRLVRWERTGGDGDLQVSRTLRLEQYELFACSLDAAPGGSDNRRNRR